MSGLRRLGSSEPLRLALAIVLAAGAVVLGESLLRGGGHHRGSNQGPGHAALAAGGPAGAGGSAAGSSSQPGGSASALAGASGSSSRPVLVAGGPAVTRALHHGSMTVVIDRPSSGLFAEQNRAIARGATVALDELNAAGGLEHHVRVKLVQQSLDGLSASALQAQLRADTAAVLILPCDTDSQLSIAASAAQFGMLMLAPCNPDPTAGQRYPTYWPVGMGANDEAAGLVNFMGRFHYRTAFVVNAMGGRFMELTTSYFRRAAQTGGVQLVGSASIALGSNDFSALAHTIETTNPKPAVIYTALPPPFANRLAAGLRAQGIYRPLVGTTAMDSRGSLSLDAEALENAFFPSYGFPREDAPARRFAGNYRKRFRNAPAGGFPGLGLETIRLLADAARKGRSAQPSAIQRALAAGIALQGVGLADRSYRTSGDHNPIGPVAITKIAAGSLLPLIATEPSPSPP
jgi:ABC-type branched-subunit amino acid transport system substrate-binding protein